MVLSLAVWAQPAAADGIAGPCKDREAGTPCEGSDQNKCTFEQCDGAGNCVPSGQEVACHPAEGQCDNGKVCEPTTGECVDLPDKPAGTPCELDRDKCTPDACNGDGFCVHAGPAIECPGPVGFCDNGKFCDAETGSCVDRDDKPAGTPCERDADKCTDDECNGNGFCVPKSAKTCDDGELCTDDTCDKDTGACRNVEDPTNNPVCSPDTDIEVKKEAKCRCEEKKDRNCKDYGHRLNLGLTRGGDDHSSDDSSDDDGDENVVFCKREEDKSRGKSRHKFFFGFGKDSSKDKCRIAYDITVTNKGPGDATGVEVTDLLPAGVKLVEFEASQGSFDKATGVWSVGNLAVGAEATLAIDVKSDEGSSKTKKYDYDGDLRIKNCADLTALDQRDTNPLNDSSCVTVSTEDKSDKKDDKKKYYRLGRGW
jgi:uncharacterized repeat protein (TIGR01451 family)